MVGFAVDEKEVSGREAALTERYVVLIEWNGDIPPTKWYRRLHKSGIRVRTKESADGVVASRLDATRSTVIVQEGAVITFSYSLARMIAAWLTNGIEVERHQYEEVEGKRKLVSVETEIVKPALVLFGKLDIEADFEPSIADVRALEHMETVHGRRGRKPDAQEWAVTCYECMETHSVESGTPTHCPVCNGVQIDFAPGTVPAYKDNPSSDVLDYWFRTRFGGGRFIFPKVEDEAMDAPSRYVIDNDWQAETAETLHGSPLVEQMHGLHLGRQTMLHLLDAAYTVRSVWSDSRRMNARIEAVTQFLIANSDPAALAGISMSEMPQPDLFDLAGKIGAHQAAGYALAYMARKLATSQEEADAVEIPMAAEGGAGVAVRKRVELV